MNFRLTNSAVRKQVRNGRKLRNDEFRSGFNRFRKRISTSIYDAEIIQNNSPSWRRLSRDTVYLYGLKTEICHKGTKLRFLYMKILTRDISVYDKTLCPNLTRKERFIWNLGAKSWNKINSVGQFGVYF